MEDKLISIEAAVFELRFVMLLETGPQTNHYNQLMFSEEQYKEINRFIQGKMMVKNTNDQVTFYCKHDVVLPSEIKPHYPALENVR